MIDTSHLGGVAGVVPLEVEEAAPVAEGRVPQKERLAAGEPAIVPIRTHWPAHYR